MSWRDNLQQASFRGVEFHVLSHEYSVGRRNVVHQYPFKDDPYIEDLGLDADEFTIEGYIIATASEDYDYFTQRNLLISALKQSGPGTLIHPYLGAKYVALVGKARIREVFSEGGIARFTMTFAITAGESSYPKENIDPSGAVDNATEDLTNTVLDSFYDQYDMDSAPTFSKNSIIADMGAYISLAKSKVNSIRRASESSLGSVKSILDDAKATMIDSVSLPCAIGNSVLDCVDSVLEVANIVNTGYLGKIVGNCSGQVIKRTLSTTGDIVDEELGKSMVLSMLGVVGNSDITGFGAAVSESTSGAGSLIPIIVTTTTTARQAANRLAFINMTKSMYLAGAARAAIRSEYRNQSEMEEVRDAVVDSMDYLLLRLGDESASDPYKDYGIYVDNREIYSKIEALRSEFAKGMKNKFYSLPYEIEVEVSPEGTTSLHLAYDKYEDLGRAEEVFNRNQPTVQHPGFFISNAKMLSK